MSRMGTVYIDKDTFLHKLDGSVKFLLLMSWMAILFMYLDVRVFTVMLIGGIVLLMAAQIPFRNIKPILWIMIAFNLLNSIFIVLLTPGYGTELVGTNTLLFQFGFIRVNLEIILYVITLSLKYANMLPITVIFIFTTHPSRFASSLNKIGIPYKIAYAVNIAFRYIPDIQLEFKNILNSQQARGLSFKKGEASLRQRIKNAAFIAVPLVTSALQRIEIVSNAMELRGFGKYPKRTWYNGTRFTWRDYSVGAVCIVVLGIAIWYRVKVFQGLWYPY